MTKIVYERLKVTDKKRILAGNNDPLPVSNEECSPGTMGDEQSPYTLIFDCLVNKDDTSPGR